MGKHWKEHREKSRWGVGVIFSFGHSRHEEHLGHQVEMSLPQGSEARGSWPAVDVFIQGHWPWGRSRSGESGRTFQGNMGRRKKVTELEQISREPCTIQARQRKGRKQKRLRGRGE